MLGFFYERFILVYYYALYRKLKLKNGYTKEKFWVKTQIFYSCNIEFFIKVKKRK